jgi:hypothetical protein
VVRFRKLPFSQPKTRINLTARCIFAPDAGCRAHFDRMNRMNRFPLFLSPTPICHLLSSNSILQILLILLILLILSEKSRQTPETGAVTAGILPPGKRRRMFSSRWNSRGCLERRTVVPAGLEAPAPRQAGGPTLQRQTPEEPGPTRPLHPPQYNYCGGRA